MKANSFQHEIAESSLLQNLQRAKSANMHLEVTDPNKAQLGPTLWGQY